MAITAASVESGPGTLDAAGAERRIRPASARWWRKARCAASRPRPARSHAHRDQHCAEHQPGHHIVGQPLAPVVAQPATPGTWRNSSCKWGPGCGGHGGRRQCAHGDQTRRSLDARHGCRRVVRRDNASGGIGHGMTCVLPTRLQPRADRQLPRTMPTPAPCPHPVDAARRADRVPGRRPGREDQTRMDTLTLGVLSF